MERVDSSLEFGESSSAPSIPEKLVLKREEVLAARKILKESGVSDLLKSLRESVKGSPIIIENVCEPEVRVSSKFNFNERIWVPNLVKKDPWREWDSCVASHKLGSQEVTVEVTRNREGRDPFSIYSSQLIKGEKSGEKLLKIKEDVKRIYYPNDYPGTGIDHDLYDAFRADERAVSLLVEGDRLKEARLIGEILDDPQYREIVKVHMPFHLAKKG